MARVIKRILTLGEIHRRTGVSIAHLSKTYSGVRRFSADALRKVAEAQGITMEQVLVQIAAEARGKRKSKAA